MIGRILKQLRLQRGYTIVQLCDKISMNQNTYSKYERDERDVSTDTIRMFADFYHVSADYLLGRNDDTPDPLDVLARQKNLSPMERELLSRYFEIPADKREVLLQIFRDAVHSEDLQNEQAE